MTERSVYSTRTGRWVHPDHRADRDAVTFDEAVEHLTLVATQAGERAAGMVAILGEEDGARGLES